MSAQIPAPTRVRTGDLTGNRRRPFELRPDAAARAALVEEMGLLELKTLRFKGELRPSGKSDVTLEARLTAEVVQPCVVTLAPVPTKIDETVLRVYVAGMEIPAGDEVEMPEDDTREPMPEMIDLEEVMAEALALSLPDYPRAEGAGLGEAVYAGEGVAPLTNDALKPFAGLAALKDKLAGGSKE